MSIELTKNSNKYKELKRAMGKYWDGTADKAWELFKLWHEQDYAQAGHDISRKAANRSRLTKRLMGGAVERFDKMCEYFEKLIQSEELEKYVPAIIDSCIHFRENGTPTHLVLQVIFYNIDIITSMGTDEYRNMLNNSQNKSDIYLKNLLYNHLENLLENYASMKISP